MDKMDTEWTNGYTLDKWIQTKQMDTDRIHRYRLYTCIQTRQMYKYWTNGYRQERLN